MKKKPAANPNQTPARRRSAAAAAPPVRLIPLAAPFLRVLAETVVREHAAALPDLSALLVVFPNRRAGVFFRRYLLDAAGRPGILPPAVLTVNELFDRLAADLGLARPRLLSRLERNALLKQAVESVKVRYWHQLPFLRFIGIGDRLLTLYDELSRANLTLDQVAAAARAGHYPEKYIEEELAVLAAVAAAYRRRLADAGYADEIDRDRLLRDRLPAAPVAPFARAVIAGLVAPTGLELELLGRLLRGGAAELVLHADRDAVAAADHPGHHAYLHRKLLAGLGIDPAAVAELDPGRRPAAAVPTVREHETPFQQQLWLGAAVRDALTRHPAERIAVVLPDETILPAVLETLRPLGVEANLSLGLPLAQSPLWSLLQSLGALAGSGWHHAALLAAARHPLVKNATEAGRPLTGQVYRLERLLIEQRLDHLPPDAASPDGCADLVAVLRAGVAAVAAPLPWPAYLAGLREYLAGLVRRNRGRFRAGLAGVEPLLDRLDDLAGLRALPPAATGTAALELVLRVLAEETVAIPGEPLRGVQVLGVLETRNLDFDCVIVPSLNEGVFPKRNPRDLFIDQQLREALGLTTARERESHFYGYFAELTAGKREVRLGYLAGRDRIRSRFIEFLADRGIRAEARPVPLTPAARLPAVRTVARTPALHRDLLAAVGRRGLSPSALKSYAVCPYQFYLGWLAGFREPDALVEEPANREWGSAIHAALRVFYRDDYPAGYGAGELPAAARQLGVRLAEEIGKLIARQPRPATGFDLDRYRWRLDRFAAAELARFADGWRPDPDLAEKTLAVTVDVGGRPVKLTGRVDRVDRNGDRLEVIDYKLTAPRQAEYAPGSPGFTEYQLPVYALLVAPDHPERIAALRYCELGRETDWREVAAGDAVGPWLDSFRRQQLVPALARLLDPAAAFESRPDGPACRWCPFAVHCGVAGD